MAARTMMHVLAACGGTIAVMAGGCDQGAGGQTPAPPAAPTPAKSVPATPTDSKGDGKTAPTTPKSDAPKPEAPKGDPDPMTTPANPTLPSEDVTIGGKSFKLEVANTFETRMKGLSGRTTIADSGGMLFVFPQNQVDVHGFVMRDCPVPIDIIYLDPVGRIVAMHKMTPEPPRSEAERKLVPPSTNPPHPSTGWKEWPKWTWSNAAYEERLKKYSSGSASQFVIELKGNMLDTLNLKKGQKIELDLEKLKKAAK